MSDLPVIQPTRRVVKRRKSMAPMIAATIIGVVLVAGIVLSQMPSNPLTAAFGSPYQGAIEQQLKRSGRPWRIEKVYPAESADNGYVVHHPGAGLSFNRPVVDHFVFRGDDGQLVKPSGVKAVRVVYSVDEGFDRRASHDDVFIVWRGRVVGSAETEDFGFLPPGTASPMKQAQPVAADPIPTPAGTSPEIAEMFRQANENLRRRGAGS